MSQFSGDGSGRNSRLPCDSGIPYTSSLIVDVSKNETTRTETVQIITNWLIDQGYTSSAQILREEATSQLRGEHQQRKVLRSMCRAVEEGAWDSAQKNLRKLLSKTPAKGSSVKVESTSQIAALTRSLPFLLTQQQFLELVDSDDSQKAYTFFMKSVKPFESSINREHFQKLNYLLTCKTVPEASSIYTEYQNWAPDAGRFQIIRIIQNAMGCSSSYPYCRQSNVAVSTPPRELHDLVGQALSFELLQNQYPSLTKDMSKVRVDSLFAPLQSRLPPKEPLMAIDLNDIMREKFPMIAPKGDRRVRITACQPFLTSSAVVVSTHDGAVLWTPLESMSMTGFQRSSFAHDEILLYTHKYPVRGLARHESKLLCWGGSQAVVLNLALLADGSANNPTDTFDRTECVTNIFTHAAETYCSCFFPCGTIVATGLSEGTVTVWDTISGTKMYENNYNTLAIVSIVTNRTGTVYYAASKDGIIRSVDTVTGVTTFTLVAPIASEISSITLSPSSSMLLASYRGGTLRLWDVLTGNLLPFRFTGVENNTRLSVPITFGQLDSFLFSGSEDGCVYFWDLMNCRRPEPFLPTSTQESESVGGASPKPVSTRWPRAEMVRPTTKCRTHQACVSDVKAEGSFLVSCGEDGLLYVYSSRGEL